MRIIWSAGGDLVKAIEHVMARVVAVIHRQSLRMLSNSQAPANLRRRLAQLRGLYKDFEPGTSWVDELIAERRAEERND